MLNWRILKNPVNWVIVLLMIVIAGMAIHFLLPSQPSNNNQ